MGQRLYILAVYVTGKTGTNQQLSVNQMLVIPLSVHLWLNYALENVVAAKCRDIWSHSAKNKNKSHF